LPDAALIHLNSAGALPGLIQVKAFRRASVERGRRVRSCGKTAMKTILVPLGGSASDHAVLKTALAAARPHGAHLECLHIRVSPGEAAPFTPHIEFARGPALREAFDRLEHEAQARSVGAERHFREFCAAEDIAIAASPNASGAVSAVLSEVSDNAIQRLIQRARHNDLVVLGRAVRANGLPADVIERLLLGCGRPLLVAPQSAPHGRAGTALVCWSDTAPAARALAAALPVLSTCRRVVIAGAEDATTTRAAADAVVRHLAWHGIAAQSRWLADDGRRVVARLAAEAAHQHAELVVMGAYGHSQARELVFGGCTRHFLDEADRAVLLMH